MGQEKSERERKYPTLFLLSNEREENPTISTCIATLIRELPLVQVLGYIQYICLDCTYTAVTFAAFFLLELHYIPRNSLQSGHEDIKLIAITLDLGH